MLQVNEGGAVAQGPRLQGPGGSAARRRVPPPPALASTRALFTFSPVYRSGGLSLYDAAENVGVSLPACCWQGSCSACAALVLKGEWVVAVPASAWAAPAMPPFAHPSTTCLPSQGAAMQ